MSSSRRKQIPSIPVFSSSVATNSNVPRPYMVDNIYNAAQASAQDILFELEKVYLLGQSQKNVYYDTIHFAITCQHICVLENLFRLDVSKVRHLTSQDVNVNSISSFAIARAIQGDRADVDILRLFLDLGLDVRKVFDKQGDALMWAVRIGRWELIKRVLDKKGTFDVDGVKLTKYDKQFTLLAVASDRIRIADELHHFGASDTEEIPIWADQKRIVLELLNRGASAHGTCLLPNLAADQQRKEQSISFARILLDEYGANVDERFEAAGVMHRRWSRESISTPLYEAVRNNFPAMVELFLEKGADRTVRGASGMTLVECAWRNKHGGMVQLLRDQGVPEGPETKDKDVSMINSPVAGVGRTETARRTMRSDSTDEDSDPDERSMVFYRAIQP